MNNGGAKASGADVAPPVFVIYYNIAGWVWMMNPIVNRGWV